jgi:hypothetical protein
MGVPFRTPEYVPFMQICQIGTFCEPETAHRRSSAPIWPCAKRNRMAGSLVPAPVPPVEQPHSFTALLASMRSIVVSPSRYPPARRTNGRTAPGSRCSRSEPTIACGGRRTAAPDRSGPSPRNECSGLGEFAPAYVEREHRVGFEIWLASRVRTSFAQRKRVGRSSRCCSRT